MQGITNSNSSIKFNPIFDAIEVRFKDKGTISSYHETMEDALKVALIENVNRWVFIKNSFSDLNTDQFLLFLRKWMLKGCYILKSRGLSSLCEVAIITKPQAVEKLKVKFKWLQNSPEKVDNLDLNICETEEEIYEYF